MEKDPVCGMQVKPDQATPRSDYGGQAYYFCCASCKQKFDQNPQSYAGKNTAKT